MTEYCQPGLSEVSGIRFAVLHHIRADYNKVFGMWLTLSGRYDSLVRDKRLHLHESIVEKILSSTG